MKAMHKEAGDADERLEEERVYAALTEQHARGLRNLLVMDTAAKQCRQHCSRHDGGKAHIGNGTYAMHDNT